jgi:hypothetical protein
MESELVRRDTRLESQGAEFLVLGELLIRRILAYKTYTNMPGYDVVATNPEKRTAARVSVKSRWSSGASQFIIKNFDCDFVVVAKLNRGLPWDARAVKSPEFFVLPIGVVKRAPRSKGWSRITFNAIPHFHDYRDRWDLIRTFLSRPGTRKGRGLTAQRSRTRE